MAQLEDREKTHHHNSSTSMSNFPRDLLQRFITVNNHNNHHHLPFPVVKLEQLQNDADEEAEEEEIELSLGLSMNGRFGVDPTAKKIKRTTSIPEFMNPVRDDEVGYVVPMNCTSSLVRTCSLPTETEDEWRKRKELQTLRRMEARKKRSEKQRNLKAMRERNRGFSEEIGSEEGNNLIMEQGGASDAMVALNEFNSLKRTTSLTTKVSGLGLNGEKDKGSIGLPPPSPSQVSIGSSVISESECQQGQGTKPMDARSPIGANSLPEGEHKSPATTLRNHTDKHSSPETKEIVRNLLEDMPCVSTKGEGPNGKRIEGFLYKYGKGEEVRIVCVCHGSFLTPAEFVKHAGGGDVANPLKHIVVSPSLL